MMMSFISSCRNNDITHSHSAQVTEAKYSVKRWEYNLADSAALKSIAAV
jgi:hypothetical protein